LCIDNVGFSRVGIVMVHSSPMVSSRNFSQHTRHILIIDDNAHIRSLLARQIMFSCSSTNHSCAIYHLGERCEPRLTYFRSTEDNIQLAETAMAPDFALYEAATPRHALFWLEHAGLERLTIISDVMMPVDTEVGLPGLLGGLHDLRIAINLVFVSSESQSRQHIQSLFGNYPTYFLIKGSDAWNRLPDALVQGAERFQYRLLPKVGYDQPDLELNVQISRSPYSTDLNSRRFTTAPVNPLPMFPAMATANAGLDYRAAHAHREVATEMPNSDAKSSGFFGRLVSWIRG
jgi:hypothetical protein